MEKIKVLLEQLAKKFSDNIDGVEILGRAESRYIHTLFLTPLMRYRYSNKNRSRIEKILQGMVRSNLS